MSVFRVINTWDLPVGKQTKCLVFGLKKLKNCSFVLFDVNDIEPIALKELGLRKEKLNSKGGSFQALV
jgi:hypothetical protein